jgi:hypothetical protein
VKNVLRLGVVVCLLLIATGVQAAPISYALSGSVLNAQGETALWGSMTIEETPQVQTYGDGDINQITFTILDFQMHSGGSDFFGTTGSFTAVTRGGRRSAIPTWELMGTSLSGGQLAASQLLVDEGWFFRDASGAVTDPTLDNLTHLWPVISLAEHTRSTIPGFAGSVTVEAHVVPEPASLLLIATGLVPLAALRRRWRR